MLYIIECYIYSAKYLKQKILPKDKSLGDKGRTELSNSTLDWHVRKDGSKSSLFPSDTYEP